MLDRKFGRLTSKKYRFGRPNGVGDEKFSIWVPIISLLVTGAVVAGLYFWLT